MMLHKIKRDILNGNIPEQILIFTMPMVGSYLLTQLYEFADSIVLGRFAGVEAMAAVGGSGKMVINILINLVSGISAGVMVTVAQNLGRNDVEKVKKSVKTGMFVAVTFGGVLAIISALLAKPLLNALGTPQETIADSLVNMYLFFAGMIPYTIYKVGEYALRATGDTKASLLFTIITAVTKIGLDLLLTGVFKMGVWGVSISTLVSYLICAIVVLTLFHRTPEIYQYDITDFGYDSELLKTIYKIGFPAAIQSAVFAITNLLVAKNVNAFGTNAIAGFAAYNNIDNFYWSFTNALGVAIVTLVGQNYGNKNTKRVKSILKYGIIIHIIASIAIGGIIYFFGKDIATIFTTEENVLVVTDEMLKLSAVSFLLYVLDEMISSTLKGIGDSVNSMIISILGICVVRFVFLLTYKFSSAAEVLLSYPLSWGIASMLYIGYYLINTRKKLKNSN